MFQVPAQVWQEIAQSGPPPATRWAKAMAGRTGSDRHPVCGSGQGTGSGGIPDQVTLAFEVTAPLLVEYDRIQAYLRETDQYALTQVLLDLPTPEVAATVGAMEYRLTPEQQKQLESLLSKELERTDPLDEVAKGRRTDYQLVVHRGEFLLGLRLFRTPRKVQSRDRAILGFDGQFLTVEAFDQMILAGATGVWPGNAYVSATLVSALIQVPPADDPLIVRCDGAQVAIGNMKVGCRWWPVSNTLMEVPAARDWLVSLALAYTLPRGQIGGGPSKRG